MIPSVLEKFGHVTTVAVLHSQSRISTIDAESAIPDRLRRIRERAGETCPPLGVKAPRK